MSEQDRRITGREVGIVLGLTCLAALLRFVRLDAQSLWVDEYLWTLTASLSSVGRIILKSDGYPPTIALLFRGLKAIGLDSDWWLRAPSALAGTLAVPAAWRVGRRFLDRRGALVAAGLLALQPMASWYSQEAGAYALVMLVALLATLCLLRIREGGGIGAAAAYALSAGIGFGLHYYFIFILMAQGLYGLFAAVTTPERRRIWIVTGVLAALTVGAWAPLFLGDVRGQEEQDAGRTFSMLAMPYTAQAFAGGFAIGPSVRSMHSAVRAGTTPWSVIAGDLMLPGIAILLVAALFLLAFPPRWDALRVMLAGLCLLPALGPWFNSILGVGYRPRYALTAVPFALIWFAAGLATPRRAIVRVLLAALVVIEVIGLARSVTPEHRREDNRSAAALIAAAGGGDVVLLGEGADPFARYAQGVDRLVNLDLKKVEDPTRLESELTPVLTGRGDLWLVLSRPWTEDPEGRVEMFLSPRLPLRETREFAGVTVKRFSREPH